VRRAIGLIVLLAGLAYQPALAKCPPPGHDRASLESLKSKGFEIPDDGARQALALELVPCLSEPVPELRDGIAFEAYYTWMRAKKLDLATRTQLLKQLSAMLEPGQADRGGFRQPFAALVLSEVARTDRAEPWLSATQRAELIDSAASYVTSVRDYRGFDSKEGWRHGVAHGADLLMQLVLNPAVDQSGIDRLLAAVASQVAPPGDHSYIDGEPQRLARPVLFAAQRGRFTAEEWTAWFAKLADPAPLASWGDAYRSREGLARRHNLLAFLQALYVNALESGDEKVQLLMPGVRAALKELG